MDRGCEGLQIFPLTEGKRTANLLQPFDDRRDADQRFQTSLFAATAQGDVLHDGQVTDFTGRPAESEVTACPLRNRRILLFFFKRRSEVPLLTANPPLPVVNNATIYNNKNKSPCIRPKGFLEVYSKNLNLPI